jgi:DNA polymerase III alpha subunit
MLESAASLDALVEKAVAYNLKSIALTDKNGMYGLIRFAKRAIEAGIKPVLGAFIDDPSAEEINAVLLAQNNQGYSDLCKIITVRKLNEDFSLIDLIKSKPENLTVISSSVKLISAIEPYPDFYIELVVTKRNKTEARKLYQVAVNRGFNFVASNPVYFIEPNDFELHKLLCAIRLNSTIDELNESDLQDKEFYFKSPDEIKKIFRKIPEAISNAEKILDECNVDLKLGEYKYPKYDLPDNSPAYEFLRYIAYEGLHKRYIQVSDVEINRLEYELSVITEMSFVDYFLIVWDLVKEARRRGMVTIGRGSAANSIVSYCLGLTDVDPIKHNLYFERFLNKGRSTPPDVDIDFSWKERDEMIKYIFDKYGYENVAMISTTVTFRARSAFRETAKAFGFSDNEISRYSKFIPWTNAANLPNISSLFPESKTLNFEIEPWKSIIKLASRIADFPRHLSIHPGGLVITQKPITNYTALEFAKNKGLGLIITQPDMYSIEDLGLIKIDILSQRSLGVLRDTIESIKNSKLKS